MTNQKVFDKVARHLLTQNARAVAGDGSCRYRTPDGLKCAVGCLIPDELYDPEMEGKSVRTLLVERVGHSFLGADQPLLSTLQIIHDRYRVETWSAALLAVADEFKLDPSVLDEFRERS